MFYAAHPLILHHYAHKLVCLEFKQFWSNWHVN